MSLPVDPIMLLSVVNLKLRDQYKDLDALCEDLRPTRPACAQSCTLWATITTRSATSLSDYSFQIRHRCAATVPGPVNDKIRSA